MLVGAHKGLKRVPTQFLSRLRVHDPTGGVPEVWDYIAILAVTIKVTK